MPSRVFFSSSYALLSPSRANTPSPTIAGVFGIILNTLLSLPIHDFIVSLSSPATIDIISLSLSSAAIFSKRAFACTGFTATSTVSEFFTRSVSSLYTLNPSAFAISLVLSYVSKTPISFISIAFFETNPFAMADPIFPKPITPNFILSPIPISYH